jgi:hypothetical protein
MASVDNGTTVQLTGESKVTPAVGQTGKPTQAHGYGTMLFTALAPNDQSSDRGTTGNFFTETKITPAAGQLGNPTKNAGVYGVIPIAANEITDRGISSPSTSYPPVSGYTGTVTLTKYYKMVGYYTTGAVYEEFISVGAPSASSATNPNTGHALVNCYVSTFWQQ